MVADSLRWSQLTTPPGTHALLYSPPLEYGWGLWLASDQENTKKMMGYTQLHVHDYIRLLCPSYESLPCWLWKVKLPYWESHIARNWGSSLLNSQKETEACNWTICEDLDSANNHMSLGNHILPQLSLRWEPSPNDSDKLCSDLTYRNCENICILF